MHSELPIRKTRTTLRLNLHFASCGVPFMNTITCALLQAVATPRVLTLSGSTQALCT